MLQTIKNPQLLALPGIGHAFFTRQNGVSEGIYKGLNCSLQSKDDPSHVSRNCALALLHLGLQGRSLATYDAEHKNRAITITQGNEPLEKADAVVTNNPSLVLAADSADCPTVLLADASTRVIGLAHAGWRSALSGILESTLEQMQALGGRKENIMAVIGPGIAQDSYEVSQTFYRQFCEADAGNVDFFRPANRQTHWMFNLPGYIQQRLIHLGVGSVVNTGLDTYTNSELFYSCRRSFHQREDDFGGHLACLYLV